MIEPAQDFLDPGSGHQVVTGGETEGRDQSKTVNGEAHDPWQHLRSDADDEERGQTDQAGGHAQHMDAAVGHSLANRVAWKIGDALSDPAHLFDSGKRNTLDKQAYPAVWRR